MIQIAKKNIYGLVFFSFLCIPSFALLGWNNHAGITYFLLKDYWKQEPTVKVESLQSFLQKEKKDLLPFLQELQKQVVSETPHYPKEFLPSVAESFANPKGDLTKAFWESLRLNSDHRASLYYQAFNKEDKGKPIPLEEITILQEKGKLPQERFLYLTEGSLVKVSQVLATASDEPDYGMDLFLFADNGSRYGDSFGFGEQSFGNPKYEYSSQAPFHMGFYHESGLVYTLAPFLGRTYPKVRIHQFTELSKFAFRKGHDYWGYRFAGWAMHYIQDLTQPYHASVLPRVGTTKRIGVQVASMVGWNSPKEGMVQRVSDRHTLIEEYQFFLFRKLREEKNPQHPVLEAFRMEASNGIAWKGTETIQKELSLIAYDLSETADEEIEELGISHFTNLYEDNHPLHKTLISCLSKTAKFSRLFLGFVEKQGEK